MKVTLRQLEVFVAIATHGQVTRAADAVAMTQSAASMALGELEQQLDITLFDRVGRQLLLNEAGRQLLPKAIDVLERVREIESASSGGEHSFDLQLAASLTVGNHLMPRLLAERFLASGTLVHLLPEWNLSRFAIYAALPTQRMLPARTRAFLDFVSGQVGQALAAQRGTVR